MTQPVCRLLILGAAHLTLAALSAVAEAQRGAERPPRDPRRAPAAAAPGVSAEVSPTEARFSFPAEVRTDWRWPARPAGAPGGRFAWGVTILAGDSAYLVGTELREEERPKPSAGFAEAFGAARPSLRTIPAGSHLQVELPGADVRTEVVDGRAVVVLRGAAMIARVFKARPSDVRFGVVGATAPAWWTASTPVAYVAR